MTQDISTTITVALAKTGVAAHTLNLYSDQINAVQDALIEREHQITESLLDIAERFGHYSREEVETELRRSIPGLSFRPAAPAVTPAEEFVAYMRDAMTEEADVEADEEEVKPYDEGILITGHRMVYPEQESKGGKKARKAQEKQDLEDRLTRMEESINTLADLARRHLGTSI